MGPFRDGWTMEDVDTVMLRGLPDELLYVPIVVSLDPPDCSWSESICMSLVSHEHFNVRGNAILGLGHLARVCRRLDLKRAIPAIAAALKDENEYVRGHAHEAAGDLRNYLSAIIPGYET
jgi:hypothetical protein